MVGQSRFLHNWACATKNVYIDIGEEYIYRLSSFDSQDRVAIILPISMDSFIASCLDGIPLPSIIGDKDNPPEFRRKMGYVDIPRMD